MSNLLHIAKWAAIYLLIGATTLGLILAVLALEEQRIRRAWRWIGDTAHNVWYTLTDCFLSAAQIIIAFVSVAFGLFVGLIFFFCGWDGRDN